MRHPQSRIARVNSMMAVKDEGQICALNYAKTVLGQIERGSPEAAEFVRWASKMRKRLNLIIANCEDDELSIQLRRGENLSLKDWRAVQLAFSAIKLPNTEPDGLVEVLSKEFGFDAVDQQLMSLLLDYGRNNMVERLWDALCDAHNMNGRLCTNVTLLSLMTGFEPNEIVRHLSPTATLRASGLVAVDSDGDFRLHSRVRQLAVEHLPTDLDIRSVLLGRVEETTLCLSDFEHLGKEAEFLLALLRGAVATNQSGILVLLHGEPGTGKTELAKTLAKHVGVPLYAVGEEDAQGGEPTRQERLQDLKMSHRLLTSGAQGLVLFDEAEDIFSRMATRRYRQDPFGDFDFGGGPSAEGSRAYIHRLLEKSPVPMIMTANHIQGFGAAVLRRMSAVIEVKVPPISVRTKLWIKAAAEERVDISANELNRLARLLPAAPAIARSAMRAARLAGGDSETVKMAVTGVVRAMNGGVLPKSEPEPAPFDPELISSNVDLANLANRLVAPGATWAVSLLLAGPPGSGKSAYARHLAKRMGLEVLHKRASDLLGMYVGQTEKQISAAFTEAIDTNAFLVFDEVDGLLGDRRGAHRNWEVSQVNEMLTWMERHPLPFACTTNLLDRLDEAAMRRFLVKAEFRYLLPHQVDIAWRRFFPVEPPLGLASLDRLTPADFAVVRKSAPLTGALDDPEQLLRALSREQRLKGGGGNPIGFCA